MLKLDITRDKANRSVATVVVNGVIDAETADQVEELAVAMTRDNVNKLIFDFSKLKEIKFAGVGVFIVVNELLAGQNGYMTIVNVSPEAVAMFKDFGIDNLCRVYSSVEEALINMRAM